MKLGHIKYPGTFHIGFYPETEAAVDALRARFEADGLEVHGPDRGHGYSLYVQAPGGFTVEVTA